MIHRLARRAIPSRTSAETRADISPVAEPPVPSGGGGMSLLRRIGAAGLALVLAIGPGLLSAQEMRSFEAENGTVEIPVAPKRIVSLNDQILTLPLYELGAPVVGSSGRSGPDGEVFLRGGMDTLGIDFHNTDIAFLGSGGVLDLEAMAALEPDLVIGLPYTDPAVIERIEAIAPTVVIDEDKLGFEGTLRTLAELSGQGDAFEARFARYLDNVARTRDYIGTPEDITVTTVFAFASGDSLSVYKSGLGAISRVLEDIGFAQPDFVAEMDETSASVSPELVQSLDSDFIIAFYRYRDTATPEAIRAALDSYAPGACAALHACRNNQLILMPGMTFGGTMESIETALELVESHVAARGFEPLDE